MKTHTLKRDLGHSWNINKSNDLWNVAAKAEIGFFSNGIGATGIHQKAASTNTRIDVRGDISIYGEETIGIFAEGTNSLIKVRRSSEIAADHGIELGLSSTGMTVRNGGLIHADFGIFAPSEAGSKIINRGDIFAVDTGIWAEGVGSNIANSGLINAWHGVVIRGENTTFTNQKAGVIEADRGIQVSGSSTDETFVIFNHGEIITDFSGDGIKVTLGTVQLTNTGIIIGNVNLGVGNDTVDTLDGVISGKIYGGKGDDTYIVKDASQLVVEYTGEGNDTIKTTADYALGVNLENLVLLGTLDSTGIGNGLDNHITGNSGANTLSGLSGADILDGMGGDDFLGGGAGADIFVFHSGYATDTITDFADGEDEIDISGFADVSNYAELSTHKLTSATDVAFDMGNGDILVILGGASMNFSDADFIFV